jgi:hypothetical protein
MHKIFGEMYNLKAIAGIVVRRPLRDTPASGRGVARSAGANKSAHEVDCAAPPFEMPYTIDVPMDEPDCWRRHQDILRSCLEIGHALLTGNDPHSPELTVEEINYLRTLQQLDQRSIAWIKIIIEGLLRTGGHST